VNPSSFESTVTSSIPKSSGENTFVGTSEPDRISSSPGAKSTFSDVTIKFEPVNAVLASFVQVLNLFLPWISS
jgi:hypothetical protein